MILVTGDAVRLFVEFGLWGGRRQFGASTAMGYADETGIVAGLVFHNYDPDTGVIEISAYSTRRDWLTKGRLVELFGYPFDQLGVRICIARSSDTNRRALRIWKALGASQHPLPDLRGEGEAEIVSLLKRETFQARFKESADG